MQYGRPVDEPCKQEEAREEILEVLHCMNGWQALCLRGNGMHAYGLQSNFRRLQQRGKPLVSSLRPLTSSCRLKTHISTMQGSTVLRITLGSFYTMTLHACIVVVRYKAHLSGIVPPVYEVFSHCNRCVARQTTRFGNPLPVVPFSPSARVFEPQTANSFCYIFSSAASHLS